MQPQKITFILRSFNYPGLITDRHEFQVVLRHPTTFSWPKPVVLAGSGLEGDRQRETDWQTHFCGVLFVDTREDSEQTVVLRQSHGSVSHEASAQFTAPWVSQGSNNLWAEWGPEWGEGKHSASYFFKTCLPWAPTECWENVRHARTARNRKSAHSENQNLGQQHPAVSFDSWG